MQYQGNRRHTLHFEPTAKRLWKLTWGLVLVIGLTLVSELFPRLGESKPQPETRPMASAHIVPSVK